ncbi:MAG: mechanosensitive ion channel family protein [Thermoplasmata archaeon]
MEIFQILKIITIPLIVTVGIFVILLYIIAYLNRFFNYLKIKETKLIGKESIDLLEILILYTLFSVSAILLIELYSYINYDIRRYTADIIFPYFLMFFSIFLIVLFSFFILAINNRAFKYMRGELSIKPQRIISEKFGYYLELIIKYIVYIFAILASILTVFAGFNMLHDAERAFVDFVISNLKGFVMVIIFISIMFIVYLLFIAYIRDIKLRSKTQKEKLLKYLSTFIKNTVLSILLLGLIMIILSMFGFSFADIFVFTFFIMVILIGVFLLFLTPIKNAISGIIILINEPFLEEDYVIINEKFEGIIMNINLLYTEIKDKLGKILLVPNSKILEGSIKVLSSPGKMFPISFEFSLPINRKFEDVENICINASNDIPSVVVNEKPKILIKEIMQERVTYMVKLFIEDPMMAENVKSEFLKRIKLSME